MPFRALIDGKNVVSLGIERDAWQAFAGRAKAGEDVVRMACCGAPGILKISPRDRQFFAHKSQPKACDWKLESPEHLELKAVVYDTILGVAGWNAGPGDDQGRHHAKHGGTMTIMGSEKPRQERYD
jgi:hypothetical protein